MPHSPYLVPFDGSFELANGPTGPPEDIPGEEKLEQRLADEVERLDELQRILYAHDHHALLLIFQAMDAAGKDGTLRAVLRRREAGFDEPEKNWKFPERGVEERAHWVDYMHAYEEALRETSRPWAPWHAIPAGDERSMRATVAEVIADALEGLDLHYPEVGDEDRARFRAMREQLEAEASA